MQMTIRALTVRCRKINPPALLPLDLCSECEHHKGVSKIMEEANGRAPVYEVVCGLPTTVRVEYVITGKDYDPGRILESTKLIEQEENKCP